MEMEGIKWKEALDFLQKFSGTNYNHISTGIVEERMQMKDNSYNLTAIMRPNNPKILGYYLKRGIEPETVKKHLKQVHYQVRAEGKDFHFLELVLKTIRADGMLEVLTEKQN